METVTSGDGTRIAYGRHGEGPPLVLLHGSSATREEWDPLVPHLADEFTVAVPDRRGRGDSGDADEYGLDREVADLRAVVDDVDGDPVVVGHSFGGLVALVAAPDLPLERLVLYEPAVLLEEHADESLNARMRARLDAGDRRGAMAAFMRTAGGVSDVEQLSWWPEEVNFHLAETVVREGDVVEEYRLPEEPAVDVPTLVLAGERGPEHLRDAARTLHDRLPDGTFVELDGLGHLAHVAAPERFADEVRAFVGGDA